jgi:hypothetical protein
LSDWTLEGELRALGGSDDLAAALVTLGLIEGSSEPFELVTTRDWYRAGAETYVLVFDVRQGESARSYLVKACIAWSPGEPLSQTFASWMGRRELLAGRGVSTPALVGVGNAQLIEEYIPFELFEAFARADGPVRGELLAQLGRTAGLLVSAGFAPIRAHDWRSRGSDVVLVDFGQDLGPANIASGSESGLLSELVDRLAHSRIELSADELRLLSESYEGTL